MSFGISSTNMNTFDLSQNKPIFNSEEDANTYINEIINQDLDNLYPGNIDVNVTPLNTPNEQIGLNHQNNGVTLRLYPKGQIPSSQHKIISKVTKLHTPPIEPSTQQESYSEVVFPLLKSNSNLYQENFFKYLIDDFNPEFWKYFYPETIENKNFFEYYKKLQNLPNSKTETQNEENPNLIDIYEGQMNENQQRDGLGKLTNDNETLLGSWKKDQFTGWGRSIDNKTGEIYEGRFVNGKLYGKGIYCNNNGKEFYIGDFRNKKMVGFGEIFSDNFHYYGQVWDKIPHGKGKINIYKKGSYDGDFHYGEIDGSGVFKWNNGNYYTGEMKEGKMNGLGKLKHKNGFIEEGYFRDGQFVKKI